MTSTTGLARLLPVIVPGAPRVYTEGVWKQE